MTAPPAPLTAADLRSIFKQALPKDAPQPSDEAFERLATEIMSIAKGRRNIPGERRAERLLATLDAAEQFRATVAVLLEFGDLGDDPLSTALAEADRVLASIGLAARSPQSPPKRSGRRLAEWHPFGQQVATEIASALQQTGYKTKLGRYDEGSFTAIIGAEVVSHVLGTNIGASSFVSAMKQRNRRHEPDWIAEAAKRIRNLDRTGEAQQ